MGRNEISVCNYNYTFHYIRLKKLV